MWDREGFETNLADVSGQIGGGRPRVPTPRAPNDQVGGARPSETGLAANGCVSPAQSRKHLPWSVALGPFFAKPSFLKNEGSTAVDDVRSRGL